MATQKMVSITKTVSVCPKSHHPPTLLSLSNLDRQCPMLMYMVFFYKPSHAYQNLPTQSLFHSLKSGLEQTLLVWYPAAGRLTPNPTGKLNLLCNNGGAVLVEAVTQVKISELGDLSQYNEFYENLVFKPVFNGCFSEMPLVVAQVTRFGCGGYAVGVGTSHSLFDGPATFNFLCAWASKTAMRADGGIEMKEPVHERGRLLVSHDAKYCNNPVARVAAFDHLHQLIKQAAPDQNLYPDGKHGGCKFSEIGCPSQEKYVVKTFHVSGAMIESLKRKISGGKNSSTACSSFEVVAAHLWKARTKALGLRKERIVCLQFAVDMRNKLVPPLPKGFCGNAYVLGSVTLTAGELEEESHGTIVGMIKESKKSLNNDYLSSYIKALEAPQATLPPLKELTMVSDWTRTPFHKVDFGHGEAVYASPLVPPVPQVAYFMQNPNEGRGTDVRLGLFSQHLHAFTHYFIADLQ